jgi:ABC-2 type transport system permease protein
VILLGKTLASVVIGGAQALLVLAVAAFIPAIDFEWQYGVAQSVALTLFAIVVLNFFLSGLGQILASRIGTMQGFHLVMNLVLFPFLFLSGAFFPLADLPAWLKLLGWINPLAYAVDLMQLTLYAEDSSGRFGIAVDVTVLSALAAAAFLAGTGSEADRR